VLDLGCGHGQLWAVLGADAVSAYHGVDISTEAVEQARQRSAGPATFEAADLLAWHAPTRFDVIVLNEVLYYLPDPVAAVSHAYGMLAAGGVLVISMFRHRNVPLLWRDLSRRFPLVVYADVKNGKGEVVNVRLVRAAPAAPTPAPTDR
jgi:trans-aconitate methyltransferase